MTRERAFGLPSYPGLLQQRGDSLLSVTEFEVFPARVAALQHQYVTIWRYRPQLTFVSDHCWAVGTAGEQSNVRPRQLLARYFHPEVELGAFTSRSGEGQINHLGEGSKAKLFRFTTSRVDTPAEARACPPTNAAVQCIAPAALYEVTPDVLQVAVPVSFLTGPEFVPV